MSHPDGRQGAPLTSDLVVGPSHALRWGDYVQKGIVRSRLSPDRMLGKGGVPLWSASWLARAEEAAGADDFVAIMVGDFRFGNGICLSPAPQGEVLADGFLAIEHAAMTPEFDRQMYRRWLAALHVWRDRFDGRARYIFWCQFGQEVQNRLEGRHIVEGRYRHPTWNFEDVIGVLGSAVIDVRPLLQMPMHEVVRLFIDKSSHPSQIGYRFLEEALVQGREVREAYGRAVAEVEGALIDLARRLAAKHGRKVVITGRSVWLDTLVRYLGSKGGFKLAEAGLVLAPLDAAPGYPPISEWRGVVDIGDCAVVALSAGGFDLAPTLAAAFGTDRTFWYRQAWVDWEGGTDPVIRARKETPRFRHVTRALNDDERKVTPVLQDALVEIGPAGHPTWLGIRHLLDQVESGQLPLSGVANGMATHRIENEVLLTSNGVAFLAGGNHSVLKFATGELKPSDASIANFRENIGARMRHARDRGIRYAHLIFPDKQSVLEDEFPFGPVVKLGHRYLRGLSEDMRLQVLYPHAELKASAEPFYPLDTHLTDAGSLVVLRMLLRAVGIEADRRLDHIAERINKPLHWSGDLGSKLTPRLYQNGLRLDPDWRMASFQSPGGFNDGLVDILFSPQAPIAQTVLLFGDSFFRMMLDQLGAVFQRVICLRTRYYHPEMIELVKPDIVFSGNAERYLSNVDTDANASAFSLYPQLRGDSEAMPQEFLDAYRAITAPRSDFGMKYLDAQGVGSTGSQPDFVTSLATSRGAALGDIQRVLVATHHLFRWGGSELVAMELAEEVRARGCEVEIYCPFADTGVVDEVLGAGMVVHTDPERVDPGAYDLIYAQHQVMSRVLAHDDGRFVREGRLPVFVCAHLSPYEPMEFPGPFVEESVADVVVCNSEETASRLADFGARFQTPLVVQNPAPASFDAGRVRGPTRRVLKRLLSVGSALLPEELKQAFALLREQGVDVTCIGYPDNPRRLLPADVAAHDAVVCIGKTVQYALRGRKPVYCYDRFGGPGWLHAANHDESARVNFSGRGSSKRAAPQLVKELLEGYASAGDWAAGLSERTLAPYRLEGVVDELLRRAKLVRRESSQRAGRVPDAERADLLGRWKNEAATYLMVDRLFVARHPNAERFSASARTFAERLQQRPSA